MQNKNIWFCTTTEDKEVKLLLKTQQNQSFYYHILMWRQIDFPEAVIGSILKKSCDQFYSPGKSLYFTS